MAAGKPFTLTPYLCFTDARKALDFYTKAFGATESLRLVDPDSNRIGHAELAVGDVRFMLSDEYPEIGVRSAETIGATPISLCLQVPDVDAFVDRAVQAGATLERPVADEFYGARRGIIVDPFGYRWMVQTEHGQVSGEEMQRRYDAAAGKA